jgi:hypothetical protein
MPSWKKENLIFKETKMDIEARKYPIGKAKFPSEYPDGLIRVMVNDFALLPADLRAVAQSLTKKQKHSSYRDGGWTALQIIHHIADSHCNAYTRLKLTLTEDHPTIKPYDENLWASLEDGNSELIEPSLKMIEGVHERMTHTFNNMVAEDFERRFFHPQQGESRDLYWLLSLYHWHGRHHLGQIRVIQSLVS